MNNYSENTFEKIKHITADGIEYWNARELQLALKYKQWRRFSDTIARAKIACENSGNNIEDHFADVGKMVEPVQPQKEKLMIICSPDMPAIL